MPLVDPARRLGMVEVLRRRYLLQLTVRREISARYMGTKLGLAWSYINPSIRFVTFFFVFGIIMGRGLGVPQFAIHLFAGMIVMNFWMDSFNSSTRSLLNNKAIIQKMNVPREMFPVSSMLVSLYHTIPQSVILFGACFLAGWQPDLLGFASGLLGLAIVVVFSTAMGIMFSVVGVLFRDFTRIVQTITNMSQFAVPMMYPYALIAQRFPPTGTFGWVHDAYFWNPLAQAVLLFQRCFWWTVIGPEERSTTGFDPAFSANFPPNFYTHAFITLGGCVVLLVVAQLVFRRLEGRVPEMLT
jgi:ABC-2 type transport system permease protein